MCFVSQKNGGRPPARRAVGSSSSDDHEHQVTVATAGAGGNRSSAAAKTPPPPTKQTLSLREIRKKPSPTTAAVVEVATPDSAAASRPRVPTLVVSVSATGVVSKVGGGEKRQLVPDEIPSPPPPPHPEDELEYKTKVLKMPPHLASMLKSEREKRGDEEKKNKAKESVSAAAGKPAAVEVKVEPVDTAPSLQVCAR
jgi:hypothetical protein